MRISKILLLPAVLMLGACSLFGSKPNPYPAPNRPAMVEVSLDRVTETTVSWNLTCVVPSAPVGGEIEACDWNIKVNGTAITKPAAGFTTTVVVERPEPTGVINLVAEVRSVRRGLLSTALFSKAWAYTEPDVAPPVPTDITVVFSVVGDEIQANLTCAVVPAEQIETCAWTGTVKLSTAPGAGTPVTIANGLTTSFKFAKPEPTQTIVVSLSAVAVRRGLQSTATTKTANYTQPDVNPPAPTDIIIEVIPE